MPVVASAAKPGETPTVPPHFELLWPTLRAVRGLGNSARLDEIDEKVFETRNSRRHSSRCCTKMALGASLSTDSLGLGPISRESARSQASLAESGRPRPVGRELSETDIPPLLDQYKSELRARRAIKREAEAAGAEDDNETEA
jgi:hypothetical protein